MEQWEPEERTAAALIQNCEGAERRDGFWVATARILGMTFEPFGRVRPGPARLEWPVREEALYGRAGLGRFRPGQICRLRVRGLADGGAPERWYVSGVLEEEVSCKPLEELWAAYRRPVVLEDKVLGRLILSRTFGILGGTLAWNGGETLLILKVAARCPSSWRRARAAARKLAADQAQWDRSMRAFAARRLTGLANDWRTADERRTESPITEADFARRITLSELDVTAAGEFTACYRDGGMFWGHLVAVRGSLREGLTGAEITG